jgi:hypothetical protein
MRMWLNRLPAAALVAVTAIGLSAGAAIAQVGSSAPHQSWQLRAQVRAGPGTRLSNPRTLPDAVGLVHQAACRGARDLLGNGEPARTKVRLTLWRQSGPTDATKTGSPDIRCHTRPGRISAFSLWTKVPGATGWVAPPLGLDRVAEVANTLAEKVMATGEPEWITLRLAARQKPVRGMIRSLAERHGVSITTSLRVAACESGFSARAYNYPYAGVYQQDVRRWSRRARLFGHPGASPFDPYANVDVSLKMARAMGWGHWGCA